MKMDLQLTFLVSLVSVFGCVYSIDFADCGSLYPINAMDIEGCVDGLECRFYIGESTQINISLSTSRNTTGLQNEVYVMVRGQRFDIFTVTPENPCEILQCPIRSIYDTNYIAEITTDDEMIPVRGVLSYKLYGDLQDTLVCFTIPLTIQYPPVKDVSDSDVIPFV